MQRAESKKGMATTPPRLGSGMTGLRSYHRSPWEKDEQGQWVRPQQRSPAVADIRPLCLDEAEAPTGELPTLRAAASPDTASIDEGESSFPVMLRSAGADEAAGPDAATRSAAVTVETVRRLLVQLKGASPELRTKLLERLFKIGGPEALEAALHLEQEAAH